PGGMGSPFRSAIQQARSSPSIAFAGAWFAGWSGRDADTHERPTVRARSRTPARALGHARAFAIAHPVGAGRHSGGSAVVPVAERPAAVRDRGGHRLSLRAPHRAPDGPDAPASPAGSALRGCRPDGGRGPIGLSRPAAACASGAGPAGRSARGG